MKPLRLFLLSALLVCFAFNDSYAQKTAQAQEMANDMSKIKNGFELMEKGLVGPAQSHLKNFTVTEVNIDQKTGMIIIKGKNAKGAVETLENIADSPYYDPVTETSSNGGNSANSGYFQSWWDWLFGTERPTETEEHQGDPLPDHLTKPKPTPEDIITQN